MGQPPNVQEAVPVGLDMPLADWQQTPPSVQPLVWPWLQRLEAVEARLQQDSTTSQRPPSADAPYKKARKPAGNAPPRKAGGPPGPPGHRQSLLAPTAPRVRTPQQGAGGHTALALPRPDQTHQVIALPVLQRDVTHVVWHAAWCPVCAQWTKAQLPSAHTAGYGPRLTALVGERAGTHGTGRRTIQPCCASVLPSPLSLGALQKMLDRVAHALAPHSQALASQARRAPGNDMDDTPWFLTTPLHGRWGMASDTVACYRMPPHRSQEAFTALRDDWEGRLVSEGYGVYQSWVPARQTCLAPLLRTARGLAARPPPARAHGGTWALAELQRLCPMATAPPTGGEWRAGSARLGRVSAPSHACPDDAGRFARRLLREMDARWVFLAQQGVEPTHHRAERAWRCGGLWRKRSQGTARTKGNRWVERLLSLQATCRLQARSTSSVLVAAVTQCFRGQQPDLAWITQGE
jgi:transposase